ncbi:MAG TPA: bifunctional [glutamine synthetase] adenylyltransferase/[glutamine synthetase]-adenylyl-L-tyrosine phosphorylase, partial [Streptosporangiaceae bacterium]|nr:bifunctional [glutamine synthetase] adenylyltransferase/[glutamine synthetase]-adenylyl-L-tyrosine phosphorylase [Streptosporangiaceae bacterium]
AAADPDLALSSLARLLTPELRAALFEDPEFRDRLIAVLGVSSGLADHLTRHPADMYALQDPEAPALDIHATTVPELAAAYRRQLLHLAARDLTGAATIDEVAEELADIAAAVLESALAIARAELPQAADTKLAVIAMGKCGARELNYASDVDVIFVADPADANAERLAAGLIGVCARSTPEGSIFPVDPNLRPEGRSGPLVRTLASHQAYYERWAKTWEFQALLKARPVAGDAELGAAYIQALGPLVWQASHRDHFVEDVQAMRRRVEESLPAKQAGRELKLGPGGLRDIEFAVQLLQLVHGSTDESVRAPATLPALAELAAGGYVGRADADDLAAAYRFLRRTEHLLQLYRLSRTHTLPDDPAVLRRLGRAFNQNGLWFPSEATPARRGGDPAAEFDELWRRHARQVRRLHEKLFYRPLLDAVARLPSEAARLSPSAARARLEALGYVDPAGALRHIDALTSGVSRRAAIQRTLLPVLLGWFADFAEPDAGLLAFRQVSEALGESPWYLRLLRDETKAASRVARVLASSRYAAGLLLRAPEAVALFGDDAELVPRDAVALAAEMMAPVRRHADDAEAAVTAVRSMRRRELLRIAAADVLEVASPAGTGVALTDLTRACLEAALAAAVHKVSAELRGPLPTRFAVIAMGRFGGYESGYGSDADVLFVHDPLPGSADREASDAAHAVAAELRRLLSLPVPDPPLMVDADLRPEGRQGPLVRTLAAYRAYYQRWSAPWEAQALLRACFAAGDPVLGAEFVAMADEFRYCAGGLGEQAVREIRRIKARVEAERIPRGADPALHVKLGPGGLADVEWTVQLLQLQHAYLVPALRTTRTLDALAAAVTAGLLEAGAASALRSSWELAARIRNAITLVTGRPGDVLPAKHTELTAVARLLGYKPGNAAQALEEDYRRLSRRARNIMEPLFYG